MKNDLKQVEHCGGLNGALYDSGQTGLHKKRSSVKNDLKQVEHCRGLNDALYDSGQTSLHKRSDVKNGRRIIKSSLVNNVEMVKIVKEEKKT